jgi:hypothetical protein
MNIPPGPVGVIIAHVIFTSACVVYDPSIISPLAVRGLISIALWTGAIWSLLKAALADPGTIRKVSSARDMEIGERQAVLQGSPIKVRLPIELRAIGGVTLDDSPASDSAAHLRFCAICEIQQPLRTKHCAELNVCIRTFDHHCPWISNSIGENNRAFFLMYLTIEFACILCFMGTAVAEIVRHGGARNKIPYYTGLIAAVALMSIFLLMVGLLCVYHVYLACANLTTWEHSSWRRITYLQDMRQSDGSPFSGETIATNIRIYLRHAGSVEFGMDGGIVWKLGAQRNLLPSALRLCCD